MCHDSSFEWNGVIQHIIIVHDFCQISTKLPRVSHVPATLITYTDVVNRIQTSTKEVEMSTKRFLTLLIVAVFLAVIAFTAQAAFATGSAANDLDSATRSYIAWAKAVEEKANALDSATRSYIAWAKAVEVNGSAYYIPVTGTADLDSATRSYTAWAKATSCEADLTHDPTIDSATRSYIGWAKFIQCGIAR